MSVPDDPSGETIFRADRYASRVRTTIFPCPDTQFGTLQTPMPRSRHDRARLVERPGGFALGGQGDRFQDLDKAAAPEG